MTQLVWKETRDLAPAGLVAGVAAAGICVAVTRQSLFPLPALALLCAGLGTALGIAQGVLDRRRRDDAFLLHRPLSAARLHAVRGLVGAAFAACAGLVVVATVPFVPSDFAAFAAPGGPATSLPPEHWVRVDPDLVPSVVCVVAAVLFHAVARLAMSPRRWISSALLVIVLPVMTLYALLSIGTESAPWLAFAAVFAAATTLDALNLARRPA